MKRSLTSGIRRKAMLTFVAMMASIGVCSSARAEDYKVDKMKYKNRGAYSADFEVRYKYNGVSCQLGKANERAAASVESGENYVLDLTRPLTVTINADDGHGTESECLVGGSIPDGVEVWGVVHIDVGDVEPCRKDGTKFYFDADEGGTVTYKTKGTTLNDNRCTISDKP